MKGYDIENNESVLQMGSLYITGNIVCVEWFKTLKTYAGKPDMIAANILGDIVYWYRPMEVRDETTGEVIGLRKKFAADKLQRSYDYYVNLFGLSKIQVKAACKRLQSLGVIDLDFRVVPSPNGLLGNVMFIGLHVDRLKAISDPSQEKSVPPMHKKVQRGYTKKRRGGTQKSTPPLHKNVQTLTDNTTETSTETPTEIPLLLAAEVSEQPIKEEEEPLPALSEPLKTILQESGVYNSVVEKLPALMVEGWTEADFVAVLDWQNATNKMPAAGFGTRIKEKTRAPSRYYEFTTRRMCGHWYPGKEEEEAEEEAEETTPVEYFEPMFPVPDFAARAWVSVLGQLQMEMPRASFDTWVRDTRVVSVDADIPVMYIATRNSYAREWLENRMTSTVERLLVGIVNQSVDVKFVIVQEEQT